MGHNTSHPTRPRYAATDSENMQAFDKLPPKLRAVLNYGAANWSAKQALDLLMEGEPVDAVVHSIISADRQMYAEEYDRINSQ